MFEISNYMKYINNKKFYYIFNDSYYGNFLLILLLKISSRISIIISTILYDFLKLNWKFFWMNI